MYINIITKINNNKFCNIIKKNNIYYIFGITSVKIENNLNKFTIFYETYDSEFNFIANKQIKYNFSLSTLIWDITENEEFYIFLIEQKSININNHECKFYKYYIKKEDIENFIVEYIETIELKNHLISKICGNKILASKIEIDEERPEYYWGKYLFNFKDENNVLYRPIFNDIVDYDKDKGHIIHYIEEIKENINVHDSWDFNMDGDVVYYKWLIIFSIRHKYLNDETKYYYKIYSSYSDNLKYFYDTKEIKVENEITKSEWYCYPEIFKKDNKYYVLLNQDDFGKEKETLLGELIID